MPYTASATSVAGRNGHVESSDGLVKFDLTLPKELGGPGKPAATNPEQLFAAGYSACFGGALGLVASQEKVHPQEIRVTAEVTIDKNDSGFFLAVKLRGSLPGVDRATAEKLMHKAHEVCPYSKATRGNIKVELAVA
jgi:Ohr subfamily peroxiredoxin